MQHPDLMHLEWMILAGRSWAEIERGLPEHPPAEIRAAAIHQCLVLDLPGAWPQIADPDEMDGIKRAPDDRGLAALLREHRPEECRSVPVRRARGGPSRGRRKDDVSMVPSFGAMAVER